MDIFYELEREWFCNEIINCEWIYDINDDYNIITISLINDCYNGG